MSHFEPLSQTSGILYADQSTLVPLPAAPSTSGQPIVPGYVIDVVDNLQTSGTTAITITAPLAQNGTSVSLSTNGGSYRFTWTGAFYAIG